MKQITCDGNEAIARASYLFTEVAGIYPITPSSPMPKYIDIHSSQNEKNIFGSVPKVVEMQSEAGAIGMCHGALELGSLATTYTSSQGLLLMIPNMYKIAGEMWPFVMHVAARSLSTHALSIFSDHQDIYSIRATGFCMLSSSNVQDAYYLGLISHLSAIESSLPFMHFMDGFRTSHEINKINILEEEKIKEIINKEKVKEFRNRALNNEKPVTRGTNQNSDIYFQITESRNKFYEKVPDIVENYMKKINKIAGTDYKPFNYYGSKNAKKIIVAMGSVCNTIKEVIDHYDEYGLIEVHLYRPFSKKKILEVFPETVEKVAVLDMTKEAGSIGEPLYLDIREALKDKNVEIVGGRYGLSSKDTTPGMIKAVYDMLDKPKNNFTIGIEDDITNLSLKYENINLENSKEILIYGYGSDGMVSASKSLINILSEEKYIQGYFEYDPKKSGGVTTSHLRVSDKIINSSYLVYNPDIIVISNDNYLKIFDPISNTKDKGKILINTGKNDRELLKLLNPYKKLLRKKQVRLFSIDANAIAEKHNLGRKISMIMEKAILNLLNIDKDQILENFIDKKFGIKSKLIAENNINSLKEVKEYLKEIILDNNEENIVFSKENIYKAISHRLGNSLKVSEFSGYEDGTFIHSKPEMNYNTEKSPEWIKENCVQCSFCSLMCPHGVIRPYILDKEEYEKAPEYIKEKCKPALGLKDYFYIIGISSKNCTGCGVCISTCPGLKGNKALAFQRLKNEENDKVFDYLEENIKEKNIIKKDTIKGSQLIKPKFAFHGACAGCGETAYIKLLTQLTDNLIIANATGCSSIYGGELPNLPYDIPWASSLFEDNAEFGFGMLIGYETNREKVRNYMLKNKNELFDKWLNNSNNYEITKEVYEKIDFEKHPKLKELKNYIISKNIWAVGGDGWAYDIGFSGIDHVLSSNSNINILVLNTESYSNTGGQQSKASPEGAVLEFATLGKKTSKKDLAKIAMSYPNTYVAQINLGANMNQAIKAITEANNHSGPSIIIAYCPCISHGIKRGMCASVEIEKLATKCGYYPIFRYNDKFTLDYKNPDFDLYEEFLNSQNRFTMLKTVNKEKANELLKENKENAIKRFNYYKSLKSQD
ncbi:MAG: pyruvate:ferredoxin (flavodoxin) oxidoreductase [Bacilli bacterium]|nr:pyruvate:ferredoxin (flavodoxin) oxidoreductase [Bacilli bacterium]